MTHWSLIFTLFLVVIGQNAFNAFSLSYLDNGMENKESGLIEKRLKSAQQFTTTFEGFLPLVDRNYLLAVDTLTQSRVSLSMWRYYMIQHLYARLVLLRKDRGIADEEDIEFADYIYSAATHVPRGIFDYLIEIRDITDATTGEIFEYNFPIWPNDDGHYGRIDADNHWKYMSLPAPIVLAQAIREDIAHTINPSEHPHWDVAEGLRPNPLNGTGKPGLPTQNLLGWKTPSTLTSDQRRHLELCLVSATDFPVNSVRFQTNARIIELLHRFIDTSGKGVEVNPEVFEKAKLTPASKMQLGWLERKSSRRYPFSRGVAYIERPVKGITFSPLNETVATMTLITGLRVKKADNVTDWCVYDWNEYQEVPQSWIDTRNSVFEFGNIAPSNIEEIPFSSQRDALLSDYILKRAPWARPK